MFSPVAFEKHLMDFILESTAEHVGGPDLHTVGAWEIWNRPHWGLPFHNRGRVDSIVKGVNLFNLLLQRDLDISISSGKLRARRTGAHQHMHHDSKKVAHVSLIKVQRGQYYGL